MNTKAEIQNKHRLHPEQVKALSKVIVQIALRVLKERREGKHRDLEDIIQAAKEGKFYDRKRGCATDLPVVGER